MPLHTGTLGIHRKSGAGVVNGLHQDQGEGSCTPTREDVLGESFSMCGILGHFELLLNFILENVFQLK